MQGFAFISNKTSKLEFSLEMLKQKINKLKGIEHRFKVVSDNNLTLIYYTNEFSEYPYINEDNILACPIGQFADDKNLLLRKLFFLSDEEKRRIISEIQGTFLVALGDLNKKKIEVFTHVTRIESAYYYESDSNIIIGSDPLIISALSNDRLVPEFDSENFISFFELGYFADESTPYKNVTCLPENSHIKVENNNLSIVSNDDSYSSIFQQNLDDTFISRLADVFMNSFNILPENSKLTLGLTGGKDSRLIFTSLIKQGFNVETFTSGFPESPDVIIAKELADYYGIPHTTKNPIINDSKTMEINLNKRLIDSMTATSGQVYAYENIHPLASFKNNTTVNGVAGEVLRGGYIIPENYSAATDKSNFVKKFYRYSDLYNEPENNYYHHLIDMKNNDDDYLVTLYKQYLRYKCGRWSSDSRKGKGYLAENYMPFLDNQLVKLIMKIKPDELYSGKLQFDLLKMIDEQSVDFRFETTRFNFERRVPINNDFEGWYNRRPMFPTSKIGKYNWRILSNGQTEIIDAFKEILLSDLNNPIYDVVNKNKISNILNTGIDYKYGRFIWALASMSTFINHVQKNNNIRYEGDVIKIDTPSDEVKKLTPKMELFSLNEQFEALNNSLTISSSNKHDERRIKTFKADKNPYIKTFSGKFNDIPHTNKCTSIRQASKIRVNLTLNKVDEELSLYVILYSSNIRTKTIKLKSKMMNDIVVFDEEISIDYEVDLYRLALKFPKLDKEKEYQLKYSFIEIYYT